MKESQKAVSSIVGSTVIVDKKNPGFGRGPRPFKSKWEKIFADNMNRCAIDWKYEPQAFKIEIDGNARHWIPDFYLPELDEYIEISSYGKDSALKTKKIEAFRSQYPSITLIEIRPQEFEDIVDHETFRSLI